MGSHMPDSTAMQLMMKPTGADEVDGYRQPYRWTGGLESSIFIIGKMKCFIITIIVSVIVLGMFLNKIDHY